MSFARAPPALTTSTLKSGSLKRFQRAKVAVIQLFPTPRKAMMTMYFGPCCSHHAMSNWTGVGGGRPRKSQTCTRNTLKSSRPAALISSGGYLISFHDSEELLVEVVVEGDVLCQFIFEALRDGLQVEGPAVTEEEVLKVLTVLGRRLPTIEEGFVGLEELVLEPLRDLGMGLDPFPLWVVTHSSTGF